MASKTNIRRLAKPDERDAPYHHGDLRDALIQAAQEILEAEGLAALSLRGVARRAGVSPAAPYHHFPDKQALLDAVAERSFDALTAAMTTRMDKVSGSAARLDASGIGYVAFAVANPALFGLMFSIVGQNPSPGTSLDLARQRAYAVLQEAAAACSPSGKASADACLRLWALVHGIAKLVLEGCVRPADFACLTAKPWPHICFAARHKPSARRKFPLHVSQKKFKAFKKAPQQGAGLCRT